ncbi:hypothetical protein H4219_003538 [Mycoemilia scoparia]|uniref:Uncharacterized protein n=1 Tax=Mycoemilia scoparia TaxID=417184 RepID=A0A9W8A3X9_9FUNG|nr:hypothetical protein H4219_003538 [Mycoemilia scoparia]
MAGRGDSNRNSSSSSGSDSKKINRGTFGGTCGYQLTQDGSSAVSFNPPKPVTIHHVTEDFASKMSIADIGDTEAASGTLQEDDMDFERDQKRVNRKKSVIFKDSSGGHRKNSLPNEDSPELLAKSIVQGDDGSSSSNSASSSRNQAKAVLSGYVQGSDGNVSRETMLRYKRSFTDEDALVQINHSGHNTRGDRSKRTYTKSLRNNQ